MLSPLLYTLYTYDCTPTHHNISIVKFADNTTVVGFISGEDESAYREEVERLSAWCHDNNLRLNTSKTKELVVDFRRNKHNIQPLNIDGVCVERVSGFRFLGVNISEDLTWGLHTAELAKKAQKRLYFLRVLRNNNISEKTSGVHLPQRCRDRPELLSLCMVLQPHSSTEERAPESYYHCPAYSRRPSPFTGGAAQLPLPQECC